MTTHCLDVYATNDVDESDADSILYTTAHDTNTLHRALIDAYNVRNANDDAIAVAYIGSE